jgi:molybdate transport system substrate-binding protein
VRFHTRLRVRLAFLLVGLIGASSTAPWVRSQDQSHAQSQTKSDITVSAAVSLKDALDAATEIYKSKNPGAAVHFNLGGSGTLQRQIEQGAPADIFISASPAEMDKLDSESLLLAGTRQNLVTNRVVLIVPSAATAVARFEDLAKPEVKLIAIGEPRTVPAGMYAEQILTRLGLYDRLKPKLVFGKDVRDVLTYVATGNADAGIVYATDARISSKVKVVAEAPPGSHSPVIYPMAVVRASRNAAAAKDFEALLLSAPARAVFAKYGFGAPSP